MRLNKKLVSFSICLVISTFFWFITAFSKEYFYTLTVPVLYTEVPADKVVTNSLPQKISIDIKAKGFSLLFYKMAGKLNPVLVNLNEIEPLKKKDSYFYYFATSERLHKIENQLLDQTSIIKVSPDTICFNFSNKVSKMVPVKPKVSIGFEKQYQLEDSIEVIPRMVRITGTKEMLDKINYIETQSLVLENVDKSVSRQLDLVKGDDAGKVELSTRSVAINVKVEKYTEGSIELAVGVENLPAGYDLKTFPDKVTLKYRVAYNDYDKISADLLQASVDYTKIANGSNKLKVEIIKSPSRYLDAKTFKITPEKVEYIIRKK